jgi:diphthamide synthase (EF-2-diphthine--ammonia ligase)
VGALTTVTEAYSRVAMHGVRESVLDQQMWALQLPVLKVALPTPCSNATYEERMGEALARIRAQGVTHVVFGDLFLEDVRAYRERQLAAAGMGGIFPLWRRDTTALAREMITAGLLAHLVCIDPRRLAHGFAGRRFDAQLLAELPADVDPCGENGEFHTVVSAGPMFAAPLALAIGPVVERDGFVFADATLDESGALPSQKRNVSV